jgi:FADH2 O2-dependent halogenase
MSARHFQVVVVGSGFSGSMTAMAARRLGLSVALIERSKHPRFAIGESTTPLTNLLLEEIADEFDLPLLRPFSKWGTWQASNPGVACGIKRGFTFFHHDLGRPFPAGREEALRRQLMVGASPNERVADTHWYRPDLDHRLVQMAQWTGVVYEDETTLGEFAEEPGLVRLSGIRAGKPMELTADFAVDASGPRGFLHRALGLAEKEVEGFPMTQALFAHFRGVGTLDSRFAPDTPPYPQEQAAVHHVFDGGWVWVLRLNNGITSAGVAATDPVAMRLGLQRGAAGWASLMDALPSVSEIFTTARPVTPFFHQPRVAFQSSAVSGRRWALLPSAAGAIDPLLSTGFPLTLLGVQRIARLLRSLGTDAFAGGLEEYAAATTREFEATARLVGALYSRMSRFDEFKRLSLVYFAAASFSEASRRLGKASRVSDYLLCRDPWFGPRLAHLSRLEAGDAALGSLVREAIEPIDILGLGDRGRDPWYPADVRDLHQNAAKLGASDGEISAMLARCGMDPAVASA